MGHRYIRWKLRKHTSLVAVMRERVTRHEEVVDLICHPPPGVSIVDVYPPEHFVLGRFSRDSDRLLKGYEIGFEVAVDAIAPIGSPIKRCHQPVDWISRVRRSTSGLRKNQAIGKSRFDIAWVGRRRLCPFSVYIVQISVESLTLEYRWPASYLFVATFAHRECLSSQLKLNQYHRTMGAIIANQVQSSMRNTSATHACSTTYRLQGTQ